MKLRQRFRLYNFISLAAPIALIGVVSVLFLIIFILSFPVEDLYITRAQLLNPTMLSTAIGSFFRDNPLALGYMIIYLIICIIIFIVSNTVASRLLASSIEGTLRSLRSNVDTIRHDSLDFEVLGSDLSEVDDLCEGIDELRRTLLVSKKKEKELRHEKNMLITNISHDLRTPITSIKGYINGINDGICDTPEKLTTYLKTIGKKADLLEKLVSDLSTYAHLDDATLKFFKSTGDLRDLLLDIADSFKIDASENNIDLDLNLPTYPLIVNIDGDKMRRVFNNLIDNAIKYRGADNCYIKIKAFKDEGNVYVVIEDNGLGIEPTEINKVFDSFYRTDNSRSSQIKGSGLGLGIAKAICDNHNGKLWLRSEGKNQGTIATVSIPEEKETKDAANTDN